MEQVPRSELERVAEALIFATDEPITAQRIAETYAAVTGEAVPSVDQVEHAVALLNTAYEREHRALEVRRWGGGFRMATREELSPYLQAYFQEVRLKRFSRSLMETLAILAYRQPTTKPEIDFVRGVDSDYALRKLLEMGLVDVVGRSEALGKPLLYGTTGRFLEQFGLNSLGDLPRLREIEELLDDPAFSHERARLLALEEAEARDAGVRPGSPPPAAPAEGPSSEDDA